MVQHQAKAIMQGWSETFVYDQELAVPERRTEGIVDRVIQRNFAHPKNLLLSMMTDDRPHIRELALL